MGNNPSKPDGKTFASPVAAPSSTNHSRREPKPVSTSTKSHPSSIPQQTHSHSHSHSPSQRHAQDDHIGNELSRQKCREKNSISEQSTPVTVPDTRQRQRGPDSQFEPSGPPRDPNYIPHSNLNFPPRLPLPIEEEVHTPGSPIITPAGISSVLHDDEEDLLPRQNSGVSSTTIDDDDFGDELQPFSLEDSRRTVPTVIKWKQGGDKVYVTGTFTSWNRKFRMTRE